MVLINAAIALAALRHVGSVKAGIRHGRGTGIIVASTVAESFILLALLVAVEEERCSEKRGKSNHANHHASRDGSGVVAAARVR
jgi:hypothetical protein